MKSFMNQVKSFTLIPRIAVCILLVVGFSYMDRQTKPSYETVVHADGTTLPQDCRFLGDSEDTGDRAQHMNGYNVCVSNGIMHVTVGTQPFPAITDSLERKNLIERLLRFQDPNKLGWMYNLGVNGNVISQFTIQGKPSSVQSQLTPEWQTSENEGQSTNVKILIPSPSDDGSFGPNEGGDEGIFYFTTGGCMIEQAPGWIYSDCQLNITAEAVITGFIDANPIPTNNAGCLDGTTDVCVPENTGG